MRTTKRSLRANTFQSIVARSSPGRYCLYSANSAEKPLSGLRCSPERKPSTMVRARSSRLPSRAMTAGSRKRSSPGRLTRIVESGVEAAARRRHRLEQARDDRVGVDALGLGIEVGDDAVTKDRRRQRANVGDRDVVAAVQQGARLAAQDQRLRRAKASAPANP